MALQMAAALGAAFIVGRNLFPDHWTWVVLTAFIVNSGNRGRGDVAHKAVMRLLGASVGTLAATALTGVLPTGNRWSIVAIFVVLAVGLWLRPLNYGYWAAGMTSALALLYGYYGERGPGLLTDRLEAIVIGAALGVAASWFLLPVRTTEVIRKDAARALAALADYVRAAGSDPAELPGHEARFQHAVEALDRIGAMLRLVPRRWRNGPAAYVPAITALHQSAAALPAVTRSLASAGSGAPGERGPNFAAPNSVAPNPVGPNPVGPNLGADIAGLRRGIGDRARPDPEAWARLAETVTRLPTARLPTALLPASADTTVGADSSLSGTSALLAGSPADEAPAPRDRLRSSAQRVLGYVNRVHGTSYELSSRLGATDLSSTYLLNGSGESRAVLKWNRDPDMAQQVQSAASLIAAARAAGWPTPAWLVSGTTPSGYPYEVQGHAPGTPCSWVTTDLVQAILPVLGIQAGLAPDAGPDWAAHDREVIFGGDRGNAVADSVAAFCPGGAALVEAVRAWTGPFRSVNLPVRDLVHAHLVPGNVLLDDGRLTALTGAERLGKGSRMHDVASLTIHGLLWDGEPGALDELLGYATAHAGPGEFEVSLAACLFAVVALHITHDSDNATGLIDRAVTALGRLGHSSVRRAVVR
jgi:hypothetical protein